MPRQIIVISTSKGPGGDTNFDCVFWLATPAPGVVVDATRTSRASGIAVNPTTAPELATLRTGTITEQSFNAQAPANATANQIKTFLQDAYAAAQAALAAGAVSKQYSGSFWDGTTWTLT